ncbi:MAG TPA: hypothetical protein GXZ31_08870 [Thermoanaerobacterales bacterium]|nr:hypothetical protein [Thermoanaerobacterales bacterium]
MRLVRPDKDVFSIENFSLTPATTVDSECNPDLSATRAAPMVGTKQARTIK